MIVLCKDVAVEDQLVAGGVPERELAEVEAVFVKGDPVFGHVERFAGNGRRDHGAVEIEISPDCRFIERSLDGQFAR